MAAAYNGPPRILRNSALILRDLQRNNASYRWENAMKENLGTCDLRAIAVSRNQSDRMDEESIRESERLGARQGSCRLGHAANGRLSLS